MKRFLIYVFALLSLVAFSNSSDKVPVTIITAVVGGNTSDGVEWESPINSSVDDFRTLKVGLSKFRICFCICINI